MTRLKIDQHRAKSRTCIQIALIALLSASFTSVPARGQTAASSEASAGLTKISVHDERPLAEALDQLQQKFLTPIVFEEAPFESDNDLRTIPVKQTDGSNYLFRELPFVDFTVTLGVGETTAMAATQTSLASYANAGLPGTYDAVQEDGWVRVFPTQVRSTQGVSKPVSPVMSYPVNFPLQTRGAVETLQLLAKIISQESGASVEILNVPYHVSDTISIGAAGESAAKVVAHMGAIAGVPFSFQCLYDATLKTYFLNVKSVFTPNPPGKWHQQPPAQPRVGPADSRWFTKH